MTEHREGLNKATVPGFDSGDIRAVEILPFSARLVNDEMEEDGAVLGVQFESTLELTVRGAGIRHALTKPIGKAKTLTSANATSTCKLQETV